MFDYVIKEIKKIDVFKNSNIIEEASSRKYSEILSFTLTTYFGFLVFVS